MKKYLCALAFVFLFAFAAATPAHAAGPKVVIGDGLFAEIKLVHRMLKMLIEEHTALTVEIQSEMTPINSWNQLTKGAINVYLAYDGTVLATFLRQDPSTIPDGMALYEYVHDAIARDFNIAMLGKLGMNNTYAVAVREETAKELDLHTLSDLAAAAENLVFGAEHEFFSLEGSMHFRPMSNFYNLKFKSIRPIDVGLKYMAMENKNIDVTVVYATDGLNRKAQLTILPDDKHFFPEYNAVVLARQDLLDAAPDLEKVLRMLDGQFTDEVMTGLSYAVDVDERPLDDVAAEFLREKGLIR
jgi:Periplasmic glycine betaine/choline-binding (lipo)protein of an ABC-type transport system (osmoprotectant binding protein)